MNEFFVNEIAVRILTLFLLMCGFEPSDGCEIRDFGYHRVWTVSACVPFDTDIESLKIDFDAYLNEHNSCPTAVKFGFYDCVVYPCNHCGGQHLYLSIYQ